MPAQASIDQAMRYDFASGFAAAYRQITDQQRLTSINSPRYRCQDIQIGLIQCGSSIDQNWLSAGF
ncbi:hypothetical protein D3C80_2131350 [compost metagenome]